MPNANNTGQAKRNRTQHIVTAIGCWRAGADGAIGCWRAGADGALISSCWESGFLFKHREGITEVGG
jgi:hypothetical protein